MSYCGKQCEQKFSKPLNITKADLSNYPPQQQKNKKKKHNPRVGKGWEMWLQKSSADFLSLNAITVVNNSAEKDTDEH